MRNAEKKSKIMVIIESIKQGSFWEKIFLKFFYDLKFYKLYWLKSYFDKIIPGKIVCVSYRGMFYADTPAIIASEIKKRRKDIEIVWLVENMNLAKSNMVPGVRVVDLYSYRALYELSTANIWIDNMRKNIYVPKKKGQFYLQTWHGGIALKRIEADVEDKLSKLYVKQAKIDAKNTDLMISDSTFCTEMYRRAFWYNGTILEVGLPRNDALINVNESKKDDMRRKIGLPLDKLIVLYAPTFRNKNEQDVYLEDFSLIIDAFKKNTGKEVLILIKHHPNNRTMLDKKELGSNVLNYSDYANIQDLYFVSDYLITDYSSTMFEFAMLYKPVFLYVRDLESYSKNERGFYFDLDNLPFQIARTKEKLISNVLCYNSDLYLQKVDAFFKEIGLKETGNATEIITNYIIEKTRI